MREIGRPFLCARTGDDEKWNSLSKSAQKELRDQDDFLRSKGNAAAAFQPAMTLWLTHGNVRTINGPLGLLKILLAGFYILDAKDIDEVIGLLSKKPCAHAGAAEIRLIEGGGQA